MSHFTVAVFLDGRITLEQALAPYDETLKVPHYITREEIISNARAEIEDYKNTRYREFLKNKSEYIKEHNDNPMHINYLENEFPKMLLWSDDELYKYGLENLSPPKENIKDDGSVFDDYNPNAKWDWYSVGGRWDGELITADGQCNRARVKDVLFSEMSDFSTYAVITPDGEWHSSGTVGWFGVSSESEDEYDKWEREYKQRFIDPAKPDWEIVIVDCHI